MRHYDQLALTRGFMFRSPAKFDVIADKHIKRTHRKLYLYTLLNYTCASSNLVGDDRKVTRPVVFLSSNKYRNRILCFAGLWHLSNYPFRCVSTNTAITKLTDITSSKDSRFLFKKCASSKLVGDDRKYQI